MILMGTDWLDVREPPAAMMIESSRSALSKFMRSQASGDTYVRVMDFATKSDPIPN